LVYVSTRTFRVSETFFERLSRCRLRDIPNPVNRTPLSRSPFSYGGEEPVREGREGPPFEVATQATYPCSMVIAPCLNNVLSSTRAPTPFPFPGRPPCMYFAPSSHFFASPAGGLGTAFFLRALAVWIRVTPPLLVGRPSRGGGGRLWVAWTLGPSPAAALVPSCMLLYVPRYGYGLVSGTSVHFARRDFFFSLFLLHFLCCRIYSSLRRPACSDHVSEYLSFLLTRQGAGRQPLCG